jgi:transcriptional regulator with XRE-family HTH domain
VSKTTTRTPVRKTRGTSFDAEVAAAVGSALRKCRESAGLPQDVLAMLAQVDRAFYGKLERGERQPSMSVILRLAKALGIPLAEVVVEVEATLPTNWRPDVERGAAASEGIAGATQRAAALRAAAARKAKERRTAAPQSTTVAKPKRPAAKKAAASGEVAVGTGSGDKR